MADAQTVDIPGVEILATGVWDASSGKVEVTDDQLDTIVQSYDALRDEVEIPVRLGHWADESEPAHGWVENVRRMGSKLVADLVKVPAELAAQIKAGRYGPRSAGLREDYRAAGKVWPLVLEHLALLGAVQPAVSGLNKLADLFSRSAPGAPVLLSAVESAPPTEHTPDASSGIQPKEHVMDDKIRELLGLGPDDDAVAAVQALKDKADEAESKAVELSRKATETADETADLRQKVIELSAAQAKRDAEALVDEFRDRIAPASREQAVRFALQDAEAARAFFSAQSPFIDTTERGSSADGSKFTDYEPQPAQVEVFKAMNGGRYEERDRISLMRRNASAAGVDLPDNFDALVRRN